MIKSFKHGVRVGIGLLSKTSDEIEAHVQRYAKSNHLPGKKAKALTKEVLSTVKKEKQKVLKSMRKETKVKLRKLLKASRDDADAFLIQMADMHYTVKDRVGERSKDAARRARELQKEASQRLRETIAQSVEVTLHRLLGDVMGEENSTPKRQAKRSKRVKKKRR